jgi:predicted transcriptional regulator
MAEPFEKLFGDTSELRVIESLIPKRDYNFNITEIAEESNISRQAAIPVVKKFLEWEMIKIDSKRGNANYYKINEDSELIKAFNNINKYIIKKIIGDGQQIAFALSPQAPCNPLTSTLGVTYRNYIEKISSEGPTDNWIEVRSVEFSMERRFSTPKAEKRQGMTYDIASAA